MKKDEYGRQMRHVTCEKRSAFFVFSIEDYMLTQETKNIHGASVKGRK